MGDFIYSILDILYEAFIEPIEAHVVGHMGETPDISIGFGNITWFTMPLNVLLLVVLGVAISTIILVFIFKLLKWLTRFGGRKKW